MTGDDLATRVRNGLQWPTTTKRRKFMREFIQSADTLQLDILKRTSRAESFRPAVQSGSQIAECVPS